MAVALPACILLWAGTDCCVGHKHLLRCGLRELGPQEGLTEGGEPSTQHRSALLRGCGMCGV